MIAFDFSPENFQEKKKSDSIIGITQRGKTKSVYKEINIGKVRKEDCHKRREYKMNMQYVCVTV